jgi:hypothetical protein
VLILVLGAGVVGAAAGSGRAPAAAPAVCTKDWDHGANTTSWDDAANWAPDGVPSAGDIACIGSGFSVDHSSGASDSVLAVQSSGTLTVSGGSLALTSASTPSTATDLNQSGGTIGGTGTLSVSGSFAWSGGRQTDAGTTVIAAGAGAALTGAVSSPLLTGGRLFDNEG